MPVGANRRYEAHYDEMRRGKDAPVPVTLPPDAYGPNPIEWSTPDTRPCVWAWVQWHTGPATRIPGRAMGWNDRIVVVEFDGPGGFRDTVVWRQAVTVRGKAPASSRGEG